MAVVELFEGAHVPLKKPLHQRRVGRHLAGFRGCENRKEHRRAASSPAGYTAGAPDRMRPVALPKIPGLANVLTDSNSASATASACLDASSDRRALPVIANHPQTRHLRHRLPDAFPAVRYGQGCIAECRGVIGDALDDRIAGDPQNLANFATNEVGALLVRKRVHFGFACTADKTGQPDT